jgi:hypothetical protein
LEKHADFLLGLIEKQPDLTLDEVVLAMRKHKIGSRTAVWRFFKRHKINFKKSLRAAEQERADVARARGAGTNRKLLGRLAPRSSTFYLRNHSFPASPQNRPSASPSLPKANQCQ